MSYSHLPDLPIIDVPYVAIDTETTGIDPFDGDRVIEVAALRFHRGEVLDSFVSLVNPLTPIKQGAFLVHGITDGMLDGAPTFDGIFHDLISFVGHDITVYHNAPFDLRFLKNEARTIGEKWIGNPVIDTLKLSRIRYGRGGNSLQQLSHRLGIGSPGHRAMQDAHATGKILLHLSTKGGSEHMTVSELLFAMGRK